ncbi:MAG: WG repeat-containing protein [Bacteroidia bacterium]
MLRLSVLFIFTFTSLLCLGKGETLWGGADSSTSKIHDTASNHLALVKSGKLYGFINTAGKVEIPIEYEFATNFSEGLACVKKDGEWGFINVKNELVIQGLSLVFPTRFKEGYARANFGNKKQCFINKKGRMVSPYFRDLNELNNGLAKASAVDRSTYGYVNSKGRWMIKESNMRFTYNYSDFRNGMASFSIIDSSYHLVFGFIDTSGKAVVEPNYKSVKNFENGLCPVSSIGFRNYWMYIDKNGKIVLPGRYQSASEFRDGLAVVLPYGKEWQLIDTSGQVYIEHKHARDILFSDGLSVFWNLEEQKFGYINLRGEFVHSGYDKAYGYGGGRAIVKIKKTFYLIDKLGNKLAELPYDKVSEFVDPNATNEIKMRL